MVSAIVTELDFNNIKLTNEGPMKCRQAADRKWISESKK